MGISNVNKAVCDMCGETRYSEHKQIDFLKELQEEGWRGSIGKLRCECCASGKRAGNRYKRRNEKRKERKVNSTQLIGNLTRDPVLKYSSGEKKIAVCRFTVAVNDRRKNPKTQEWEDNPSFIPIVTFGRLAENCGKYLAKGRKVAVNGKIQTGSYEKDGRRIYTTEVIANNVEFLGVQQSQDHNAQPQPAPQQSTAADPPGEMQEPPVPPLDDQYVEGFFPMEDEDIPF